MYTIYRNTNITRGNKNTQISLEFDQPIEVEKHRMRQEHSPKNLQKIPRIQESKTRAHTP